MSGIGPCDYLWSNRSVTPRIETSIDRDNEQATKRDERPGELGVTLQDPRVSGPRRWLLPDGVAMEAPGTWTVPGSSSPLALGWIDCGVKILIRCGNDIVSMDPDTGRILYRIPARLSTTCRQSRIDGWPPSGNPGTHEGRLPCCTTRSTWSTVQGPRIRGLSSHWLIASRMPVQWRFLRGRTNTRGLLTPRRMGPSFRRRPHLRLAQSGVRGRAVSRTGTGFAAETASPADRPPSTPATVG
jgi:hypothetical protein